jgi:hypothetical protein
VSRCRCRNRLAGDAGIRGDRWSGRRIPDVDPDVAARQIACQPVQEVVAACVLRMPADSILLGRRPRDFPTSCEAQCVGANAVRRHDDENVFAGGMLMPVLTARHYLLWGVDDAHQRLRRPPPSRRTIRHRRRALAPGGGLSQRSDNDPDSSCLKRRKHDGDSGRISHVCEIVSWRKLGRKFGVSLSKSVFYPLTSP